MKNLRKMILFSTLIIFIIVILIVYLNNINKNKTLNTGDGQGIQREVNGEREIAQLQGEQQYFILDNCINIYFKYIEDKNEQAIKGILLEDYDNQNYIDKLDNLKYYQNQKYVIEEIYSLTSTYVRPYYFKGTLYYNNNKSFEYFVVYYDFDNSTIAIRKINEKEYDDFINGKVSFTEKNIKLNDYNLMTKNYFSEEEIIEKYFYDYIENALYYPEIAYQKLDEEYSNNRFGSFDNFKRYIENQKDILKRIDVSQLKSSKEFKNEEEYINYLSALDRIKLNKYLVENTDDGKRYVCVDDKENYYIFNVVNPMKYTLKLDTYTIESEKFKTEYNNGSNQKKVQLNIDKFIKMINNKDYSHAYDVLDENFKNNYFKTEENFEKYIKNNFLEFSNINFEKFTQEGEIFIYQIVLSDKTSKSDKKLRMNVIMKLEEGTGFVMSFGATN